MRRASGFPLLILGLLAVRVALHDWIGHLISARQTAAVFFLLAFGAILRWRVGMYHRYRELSPRGE